jgi:hypothetical protein
MPFRGGIVRVAAGLYGMPTTDTLAKSIGTLTQFAKILAVPQLSAALTLAQPVANGIRDAFSEAKLQRLGYYNEFSGADQQPPHFQRLYLALLHAEELEVPKDGLHVIQDQLRFGDGPFTGCDFMLLRFDVEEERDDYNQLTAIQTPFAAALDAVASGKSDEADARYREAVRAVINAAELTTKIDRRRVVELLKEEYDSTKNLVASAGLRQRPEFDLQLYMSERAISIERAAYLGEPRYNDFV